MNDFGSIEAVWRSQDGAAAAHDAGYQRLRQFIREHAQAELRLNIAKTGGVSVLVIHFAWAIATYRPAPLVTWGVSIIVLGVAVFLYRNWTSQLLPRSVGRSGPAAEFAANAARGLQRRHSALRIAYAMLIGALLTGVNLILAEVVQGSPDRRAFHHSAASVFLAAAAFGGWTALQRRFERTSLPVLRDLEKFSRSLRPAESDS
ncbi:MAG: hypothetical protein K2X35_12575 [Bryobacteraceae bacterium]|nr:hypothetical protein [Bryobacteraceae bacterium]